jgi:hypothetical protein
VSRCTCRFGLDCTVHDASGKRWDAYSLADVAALCRVTFEPAQAEWSCYCGRHDDSDDKEMPIGTLCIWERASYEYNEWDCRCAESYLDGWLSAQTTDWDRLGRAEHRRSWWQQRCRRALGRFASFFGLEVYN